MEYTAQASVGSIVNGTVVSTQDTTNRMLNNFVLIDVPNLKCAGYLRADEIKEIEYSVGQNIEAIVKNLENNEGLALLSVKDLKLDRAWQQAQRWLNENTLVKFKANTVTKGGVIGEIENIEAFLPASRSSVKKLYHLNRLIGKEIDVQIVEAERERGNVIVSQTLAEDRLQSEAFSNLVIGQEYELKVDGLSSFGAFLEIAPGITGLLHASELSWKDGHHEAKNYLKIDQIVKVICTRASSKKAAFSLKRVQNPWEEASFEIKPGDQIKGTVVNNRENLGSFVALGDYRRVVGLVKGKMLAKGTQCECIVKTFDPIKKKAALKIAE